MYISFTVFCILFLISIYFTIRLIIPVEVAYLEMPRKYYEDYRLEYEQLNASIPNRQSVVTDLLKASYINELEEALTANNYVFRKKSSFYYNALMYALLSVVPYLVCLGFHISKKEEIIQKVKIVNSGFDSNLLKIDSMAKASLNTKTSSSSNTKISKLPGIDNSKVISSKPMLIRENSSTDSAKKR